MLNVTFLNQECARLIFLIKHRISFLLVKNKNIEIERENCPHDFRYNCFKRQEIYVWSNTKHTQWFWANAYSFWTAGNPSACLLRYSSRYRGRISISFMSEKRKVILDVWLRRKLSIFRFANNVILPIMFYLWIILFLRTMFLCG